LRWVSPSAAVQIRNHELSVCRPKVIRIRISLNRDALAHRLIDIGIPLDAGLTCLTLTSMRGKVETGRNTGAVRSGHARESWVSYVEHQSCNHDRGYAERRLFSSQTGPGV
jgi:hypothetical protein